MQAYLEVYEIEKRVLGQEHLFTLTIRNNMSTVLQAQGKYEEALKSYEEVYEIIKRVLGPEHPNTLATRNNMARVLFKQGKYEEALQAHHEVYEVEKHVFGPEHPNTLTTRNNMALVLDKQRKYKEALEIHQEVYEIQRRVLGSEHPDTLTTRYNMAGVLYNQGKFEEALQAYQEVYNMSKSVLGPDHPITKTVYRAFELVQALELSHAEIGSQLDYGINNQLFVAVKNGDLQWVRDCIRERANVDSRDNNNWTPLHYAADKGYAELVNILLQNRANTNAENNGKATPLHFAARNGHIKVVEALLSSKAIVNPTTQNNNWTPLHFTAKHNYIAIIKALLKHGTVHDARDSQGRAPVQLTNNPEITEFLNIIDKLFSFVREGNLNELISYLNKGTEVNSCNSDEKTLLQLAVEQNHLELASVLLERGANVNFLDEAQQLLIAEFKSSNSIQSHETYMVPRERSQKPQPQYINDKPLNLSQ